LRAGKDSIKNLNFDLWHRKPQTMAMLVSNSRITASHSSSSSLNKKKKSPKKTRYRLLPYVLLLGIVVLAFGTATVMVHIAGMSSNTNFHIDLLLLLTPISAAILKEALTLKDDSNLAFYNSKTNQNTTQSSSLPPPPSPPPPTHELPMPCLIYVRIPKTGSSSLVADMHEWLGPEKMHTKLCHLNDGEQGLLEYQAHTAYRARQVYQGHCNYGMLDRYICRPPPSPETSTSTTVHVDDTGATTESSVEENSLLLSSYSRNTSCYYYTWLREPIRASFPPSCTIIQKAAWQRIYPRWNIVFDQVCTVNKKVVPIGKTP
jgi:hypothetical protein